MPVYATKPSGVLIARYSANSEIMRPIPVLKQLSDLLEGSAPDLNDSAGNKSLPDSSGNAEEMLDDSHAAYMAEDYVEVPCPSHDNPLLMIPKHYRREFFDDLFKNDKFKWQLSTEKEFEWVFRDQPCTICSSLYEALLGPAQKPAAGL